MTIELGDRTVEVTRKQLLLGGGAVIGVLVAVCSLVFVGRLILASGVSAMASGDATPTPSPTVAVATATLQPQRPTATPPPSPTATPEPRVVVEAYMLNVRAEASGDAEVVGGVEQDDELVILDEDGEWLRVETPDGTVGWVHSGYVADIVVGTGAQ